MTTLQEYFNTDSTTWALPSGTKWWGQTFTVSVNHTIESVKLLLFRIGTPGEITVVLKLCNENNVPTGDDLAIATFDGNTLTTDTNGEWKEIIFNVPYSSVQDTNYAIVVKAPYATFTPSNRLCWRAREQGDGPPDYGENFFVVTENAGGIWTSSGGYFMFETYGEELTPPTPPIITNQSENQTSVKGQLVSLYVIATGTAPLSYQWYKDDIIIDGETSSTLSFYADESSAGTYKCRVSNIVGDVWTDPIVVTVVGNPYIWNPFNLNLDINREQI